MTAKIERISAEIVTQEAVYGAKAQGVQDSSELSSAQRMRQVTSMHKAADLQILGEKS